MIREVMQQALEALESGDWYIDQLEMIVYHDDATGIHEERAKVQTAITALRAALAEPERRISYVCPQCHWTLDTQRTEPEQFPVGQLVEEVYGRGQVLWFNKPLDQSLLYTHPPQRKPLTDEEITQISIDTPINLYAFVRAIEAWHGIKQEEA